jgi:glycosyltransferase involved in cell wall biosynthesis
MNLLVVSTWLPYPPDNGSRLRAYQLLRHLARRHTLTLLAFGEPGAPADLDTLRSLCAHLEVVPPTRLSGGRLRTRGLLSPVPRYFLQTESRQMRSLVAAHVDRHDAAIALQVHAARYLSGCPGVPRVFEEVEVGTYRDAPPAGTSPLGRARRRLTWWKYRRFVRGLVDEFDKSTVVSEVERGHLLTIGCDPDRVAVVPNGADAAEVLPPRTPVAGRLIYPGPVTYPANLDAVRYFVREVFPLVRRARPDATFVVTGSTGGVDLGDLAARDGVSFTGRLPQVESMLSESAACVVPLRVGGGTRLKVLQAMALGTPVVSTRKGIEGLEVEPGREALVADDGPAFAAGVLRVLNEPALANALSTAGHRLVRSRYGWDAIGDALERVVQRAVADHASRRATPSA